MNSSGIYQANDVSQGRQVSLQNIENCYDQVFKCAEQAEKDEASLETSD